MLLFGYAINTDPRHLPTAVLVQENSVFARSIVVGARTTRSYFDIVAPGAHARPSSTRWCAPARSSSRSPSPATSPAAWPAATRPRSWSRPTPPIRPPPAARVAALAAPARRGAAPRPHRRAGARAARPRAPFEVVVHRRYNPEDITAYNIVPGLLGIVLTLTLVMMTAIGVTREQERGTMESLLATPVAAARGDDRQARALRDRRLIQTALILIVAAPAVRRADGGRLARAVARHRPVHHRLARRSAS